MFPIRHEKVHDDIGKNIFDHKLLIFLRQYIQFLEYEEPIEDTFYYLFAISSIF